MRFILFSRGGTKVNVVLLFTLTSGVTGSQIYAMRGISSYRVQPLETISF
jgi:hypothetical protein